MPEIVKAALAPIKAAISEFFSASADITVHMTCTSFVNELGNNGLRGRSINLETRVSFSVGLPSLLKNPPGILPAA